MSFVTCFLLIIYVVLYKFLEYFTKCWQNVDYHLSCCSMLVCCEKRQFQLRLSILSNIKSGTIIQNVKMYNYHINQLTTNHWFNIIKPQTLSFSQKQVKQSPALKNSQQPLDKRQMDKFNDNGTRQHCTIPQSNEHQSQTLSFPSPQCNQKHTMR